MCFTLGFYEALLGLLNQTRWEWHHINFTPSRHLVPFWQLYAHHKTLYMHLAYSHPPNEHCTQHCSLHSLLHKGNWRLPCSAPINFHITYSNIPYRPNSCTPHPALPIPLPSTTFLCTQLTQSTVGKMAQGVGMVWNWCDVMCEIDVMFGGFHPYMHLFSIRKLLWLHSYGVGWGNMGYLIPEAAPGDWAIEVQTPTYAPACGPY